MTTTVDATVLFHPPTPELRFLPEGPYPLGDNKLSWVAIQHGAEASNGSLNVLDLTTLVNQSYELPGRPGFAFPCSDGIKFVVGCERRLGFYSTRTGHWTPFGGEVDSDRSGTIINDGVVWEDNLVFGTKDLEFANKKAGLYLFRGADQQLIRLRDDQICSNGKAIRQLDGALQLVDIDSPTRQVVGYDLDIAGGQLGSPSVLLDLTADPAVPDGAILTPDGKSMIISMYNPEPAEAGETRQYSLTDGSLQCVWRTPGSPQNTCPNLVEFGGRVYLVITTAIEHMPAERQPQSPRAGAIFMAETEFTSLGAVPRFPLV